MGSLLLLLLATTPLFQSARSLAQRGSCPAALPIFLQIAFSSQSEDRGEALLWAAHCTLEFEHDSTLADLLLHRFLNRPDPYLPTLRMAWKIFRALHPDDSIPYFSPYIVALPPDTLQALLTSPHLPDSFRFTLFTYIRSLRPNLPIPPNLPLPCPWVSQKNPANVWLCRGDTLRALLAGPVPEEAVRSWILKDSLRCYPGEGPTSCFLSLDTLMRQASDSAQDSLLSLWDRWGRDWPEVRQRWKQEREWETSGNRSPNFFPLRPAPKWQERMFTDGLFIDPRELLRRARRVFLVEGWPAPRTGNPEVDQLLFELHGLRWQRDRFWGEERPGDLDSLVHWLQEVPSPPYTLALQIALASRLPRLPFTQIPLKELSDQDQVLLARWMGQQALDRPFQNMVAHLPEAQARKVRFAYALERGWTDTAFRYLDMQNAQSLQAYMRHVSPWEVFPLYPFQARHDDLFLLHRALEDTISSIPWMDLMAFLARPLPNHLRIPLIHRLYPPLLGQGDVEKAALLSLQDTLSSPARLVRFFLGLEPSPPPVDTTLYAVLGETLRVWVDADSLSPLPPESLAFISGYRDQVRAWKTLMIQDTLIPDLLRGPIPPTLTDFGKWVHQKAKKLYQEGKRKEAVRLWRFLLPQALPLRQLALYHLGIFYKDEQKPDEAIQYLEHLYRLYDGSSLWKDGVFLLGGLYAQRGNFEKALQIYRSLRGLLDPETEGERIYWEVEMLKALGRYEEAVVLEQVLWKEFRNVASGWAITAALDVSQFWVLRGHPQRARALLEEVVAKFPNHSLAASAQRQLEALTQLERLQGR